MWGIYALLAFFFFFFFFFLLFFFLLLFFLPPESSKPPPDNAPERGVCSKSKMRTEPHLPSCQGAEAATVLPSSLSLG